MRQLTLNSRQVCSIKDELGVSNVHCFLLVMFSQCLSKIIDMNLSST